MAGKEIFKKVGVSALLIAIMVLSYTGTINKAVVSTPLVNYLDTQAEEYYDASIKRALYAYAIARGINALVSIIQNVEFNVVLTLPLGQALDPINDLVERFSVVMLISTTSLGIQKILMEIGSWLGFKILLAVSLLIVLVALWLPEQHKPRCMKLGYKLIILSIFIRFCVPVVGVATSRTYDLFLKEKTEQATEALERSRQEMESVQIVEEEEPQGADEATEGDQSGEPSVWDTLKGMFDSPRSQGDINAKLDRIKKTVSEATEYFVNLIIAFLLETVAIPLIVLWTIIRLGKRLI